MSANLDQLFPYYQAELAYLRRMGGAFAARYPKVAARLELSAEESPDPHVERLLESFAFLTARLQHRFDDQFPEITTALLGVLHPHLVNPVPPMAIAQFEPDPAQGKLHSGYTIPKHAKLFAQTADGLTCRFRTCYPVTLWPLEVTEAGFEPPAAFDFLQHHRPQVAGVLRLRLTARGAAFSELELQRLRFHLHGEDGAIAALYELIFAHTQGLALCAPGAAPVYRPASALQPVGFAAGEDVIPYPAHVQPATRLLQEYFHFPEKFHFFDLDGLADTGAGAELDVLLLLSRVPPPQLRVRAAMFRLGCAPMVNLFPRTSEPIRVEQRVTEYRLVADMRRERTTEIHSLVTVSGSSNAADASADLQPFYSFRHRGDGQPQRAFWHARRLPCDRADVPGTEMRLSFVDLDFTPAAPPRQMVYAHTLCTNRDLAEQLPPGALLQTEEKAPLNRIHCLGKPTPAAYPLLGGAGLWALVSGLSLNYLSLSGDEGLDAFRSMLRLYGAEASPGGQRRVEGIRHMSCRNVVRRLGNEAWRGFCSGTEITLTLDDHAFMTQGAYLFGAVVQHVFALYAALNSFTQLVLRPEAPGGAVIRFPPRVGAVPLL
ncbi:MAG TPA: type VI secretion system baseplate subunit TssF [Terriglobales bacterium]|nr:type VI secretion system baseplate subunit TssF [Terriglobales bacterium]